MQVGCKDRRVVDCVHKGRQSMPTEMRGFVKAMRLVMKVEESCGCDERMRFE